MEPSARPGKRTAAGTATTSDQAVNRLQTARSQLRLCEGSMSCARPCLSVARSWLFWPVPDTTNTGSNHLGTVGNWPDNTDSCVADSTNTPTTNTFGIDR